MPASASAYARTGFSMRSAKRPARYDPSPSPPMNTASTVEIASVVEPNTSPSFRVHRFSRMSPDDPDEKAGKQNRAHVGTDFIDRRRAPGYSARLDLSRRFARIRPASFSTAASVWPSFAASSASPCASSRRI